MEIKTDSKSSADSDLTNDSLSKSILANPTDEYVQLQRRIFKATAIASVFALAISAFFFDSLTTFSVLLGSVSGIIYLRLLARNIGNLGGNSKTVGKSQLIIPVLLVLLVSKVPQIQLLPALLGFLIYKPSMIIQVLLDSKS